METVSRWICVPCHEFKPAQGFCPGSSSVPAEGMMVSSWDERPRVSEGSLKRVPFMLVVENMSPSGLLLSSVIVCFYLGEVILDELAGVVTLEDCEHP